MVSFSERENLISILIKGEENEQVLKSLKEYGYERLEDVSIDELINSYTEENAKYPDSVEDNNRRMFFMLQEALDSGNEEIAKKLIEAGAPTSIVYNSITDTISNDSYAIRTISIPPNISRELFEMLSNMCIENSNRVIDNLKKDIEEIQNSLRDNPRLSSFGEKLIRMNKNTISKLEELIKNAQSQLKDIEAKSKEEPKKEQPKKEERKEEETPEKNTDLAKVLAGLKTIEKSVLYTNNPSIESKVTYFLNEIKNFENELKKQPKNILKKYYQDSIKNTTERLIDYMRENQGALTNDGIVLLNQKTELLGKNEELEKVATEKAREDLERIKAIDLQNKQLLEEQKEISEQLSEKSINVAESKKFKEGISFVTMDENGNPVPLTLEEVADYLIKAGITTPEQLNDFLKKQEIFSDSPEEAELFANEISKKIIENKRELEEIDEKIKRNEMLRDSIGKNLDPRNLPKRNLGSDQSIVRA